MSFVNLSLDIILSGSNREIIANSHWPVDLSFSHILLGPLHLLHAFGCRRELIVWITYEETEMSSTQLPMDTIVATIVRAHTNKMK